MDIQIPTITTITNTIQVTAEESIGKYFLKYAEATIETGLHNSVYLSKQVGYTPDDQNNTLNASVNETILFTIDIQNLGDTTVYNMTLLDFLPTSMNYVDNSASFYFKNQIFNRNPIINAETNILTWERIQTIIEDHIGPYERCTLTFRTWIQSEGTVVNTVNFSFNIYDGINNYHSTAEDSATIHVTNQTKPLQIDMIIPSEAYINDTVPFKAFVRGGLPSYTYHWDFGDGINSTQPQPTHQYTNTGLYTVTLQVIDSNNTTASASKTIKINFKDITPPHINLTTPGRYIYVKGIPIIRFFRPIIFGKINISFEVTDNHSDILFIRLFINDIPMESWTHSPISWNWTTREYGKRIIKIEAYDTSGNIQILEITTWKFF
jgi:uncharacterized repeat protein (TIGR01451 family)